MLGVAGFVLAGSFVINVVICLVGLATIGHRTTQTVLMLASIAECAVVLVWWLVALRGNPT